MDKRKQEVITHLTELESKACDRFSDLSTEQINWKPDKNSWSIGQCFEHMITMNQLYFPQLDQIGRGEKRPTFWEKMSPFSRLMGRQLIQTMHPENRKKSKTPAKAEPAASQVDSRIIDRFSECQTQLIERIQNLPDDPDAARIVITSPLIRLITYSLDDTLTLLVLHEQRHIGQAGRVMEADEFPSR